MSFSSADVALFCFAHQLVNIRSKHIRWMRIHVEVNESALPKICVFQSEAGNKVQVKKKEETNIPGPFFVYLPEGGQGLVVQGVENASGIDTERKNVFTNAVICQSKRVCG